jgi:drug/metabolite transporter (DMT)-like permease
LKPPDLRISFEAATSLILMAGVPVFIKFTNANSYTIGIVRLLMASFLIILLLVYKKEKPTLRIAYIKKLLIIGIVFSIHWITYFISIKISTASIGILGASTYGIHLIFLGWIFLKSKPRIIDIFTIAFAFWGTYLIIPEFSLKNNITLGLAISIISGLFFAMLPILHQKSQFIPGTQRALGQFIFAIPLFLLFIPQYDFNLNKADWYSLLYLGIFGTFISHSLWINVSTKLNTTVTSLIFYIIIPITMTVSYFWLGEEMKFNKILGALMIVAANIIGILSRFYSRRIKLAKTENL